MAKDVKKIALGDYVELLKLLEHLGIEPRQHSVITELKGHRDQSNIEKTFP